MVNKYAYVFMPHAEQDIDAVLEYISEKLHNIKAAKDSLDKIVDTIDKAS